jgi:hypothetical protein
MRSFLIVAAAVVAVFFGNLAANADEANWPRTNHPNPFHSWPAIEQDSVRQEATEEKTSVVYAASARTRKAVKPTPVDPWNHDYAPFGQAGSLPTSGLQSAWVPSLTAAELQAQLAANRAWVLRENARLRAEGG